MAVLENEEHLGPALDYWSAGAAGKERCCNALALERIFGGIQWNRHASFSPDYCIFGAGCRAGCSARTSSSSFPSPGAMAAPPQTSSRSGTPAAGVKNASSGGSHGGVIWPSLITAQLRRPTVNR